MPGFEPRRNLLLHLVIHDPLLARKVFQRVIAVILVPVIALTHTFGLVLHLFNDRGFLLRVLWQMLRILRKLFYAISTAARVDHIRLNYSCVCLTLQVFARH